MKKEFQENALLFDKEELTTKGRTIYAAPIALQRQIELKNRGVNTVLVDMFTLKFISEN